MKKLGCFLMAAVLVFSVMITASAEKSVKNFTDVPESHWAYSSVQALSASGVISGYPDGTFRPNAGVSRSEWAKMLAVAGGLKLNGGKTNNYTDVKADAWYAPYVAALGDNMPTYKTENGGAQFAPDNKADRQSVTISLVNLKAYSVEKADTSVVKAFADNTQISEQYSKHIASAVQNGLIKGFDDNTFRPMGGLTRAEAATMLYRAFYANGEQEQNVPAGVAISEAELKDISQIVLNNFKKVKSLQATESVDMELTSMGQTVELGVKLTSDIVVDKIMHSIVESYSQGQSVKAEMYVEKKGEMASMYFNANDTTWMKQDARIIDLKAMNNYEDPYESAKEFLEALQCAKKSVADYNGKQALLVTGILDMEDPQGLISTTGVNIQGISTSQFVQMLTGLDPIYVSMYLDSSTGLPLEMTIDMKAFMITLMKNLEKVSGQDTRMEFDHVDIKLTFSNYNNVNVSVPESVKAAVSGY